MTIDELLDQAKFKANLKSDYALAKAIGIQTGIVANWRKGKRHPSNAEAIQLATLAGLDELKVIAEIELRTANTPQKKAFWTNFIEAKGLAGVIAVTVIGSAMILTPKPATAEVLHNNNYTKNFNLTDNNLYIMRIR